MYVVTLYVEGGEHDAQTFVCGLFGSEGEAMFEAEKLSAHGTANVYYLLASASVVLHQIGAGDAAS